MHYPPHVVPYIEYNHLMKVKFFPRNHEGNLTTCLSLLTFKINFVWQTHWTVAKRMHFQDQPSMITSRIYGKIREQMIQYNYYPLLSPRKYAHPWTLACRLHLGKLAERLMVNESQVALLYLPQLVFRNSARECLGLHRKGNLPLTSTLQT